MKKELFSQFDMGLGLDLIIVSYFERMYEDGKFLDAIELLSKKWTLSVDGAYCNFPDMDSYDETEHFEGVEFAIGYPPTEEDTVIVTEETCYHYVRLACEKYLKLHPEDIDKVNTLLSKIPA
ncbi:ribonuclease toxin immunity protein CdiI [Xenorhabdus sp. PB30.3]|uniref:ribonuclease toxin immunity protein CdiI n=1 Tax=Xenorhabdus sp. PB30.3 TaxID=2788941 RepID=UPI001E2FD9AA|nr:ribonuclease toxin immunity protein CdiI [Xenorhabdus sp. PB30.3]MCC8380935.1 ribonuclease toxin immunity protein CdiI [Xenorhabdus sp. PB30.3]